MATSQTLAPKQADDFIQFLQKRFEQFSNRHKGIEWKAVQSKLEANPTKLWSLHQMEQTGGEPDLVGFDSKTKMYLFMDCSEQSPSGRRSLCYDKAALNSRKEHKPKNNVLDVAAAMGIELLTESDYRYLQQFGSFDTKTSSWLQTPATIRKLGGAVFGDLRYETIFIYHNGAESYYAARGFRGLVRV
jgi:hypothetical protein